MKKALLTALAVAALIITARAEDVTVTGEGQCAKCSLKEAKTCQNAIVVEKDGKKTTYYLAQNDTSKKFHPTVCSDKVKVTATGSVKEVEGKKELTVSKIEVAK